MSKRMLGLALSLIGSMGIGVLAAQKFYQLFANTVPAGSMTDLVRAGTHTAYIGTGIVFGVAIFAWTTLAVWLGQFFTSSPPQGTAASGRSTK